MALNRALGEIREVDGQAVVTTFLAPGLPLWPLGSHFLLRQAGRQVDIPLDRLSVVCGFVRAWGLALAAGALVWTAVAWLGGDDLRAVDATGLLAFLVLVECLFLFRIGKAGRDHRDARRALGRACHINAEPELLPWDLVRELYHELDESWARERKARGLRHWRKTRPEDVPDERLCLYYALLRYYAAFHDDPRGLSAAARTLGLIRERGVLEHEGEPPPALISAIAEAPRPGDSRSESSRGSAPAAEASPADAAGAQDPGDAPDADPGTERRPRPASRRRKKGRRGSETSPREEPDTASGGLAAEGERPARRRRTTATGTRRRATPPIPAVLGRSGHLRASGSLPAREETNSLSPGGARRIYAVLCHLAHCDGEVSGRERALLQQYRRRMRIPGDKAAAIEMKAARGEPLAIGSRTHERAVLVTAMVKIISTNGRFGDEQRVSVGNIARELGLDADELGARITARIEKRRRATVESIRRRLAEMPARAEGS